MPVDVQDRLTVGVGVGGGGSGATAVGADGDTGRGRGAPGGDGGGCGLAHNGASEAREVARFARIVARGTIFP